MKGTLLVYLALLAILSAGLYCLATSPAPA